MIGKIYSIVHATGSTNRNFRMHYKNVKSYVFDFQIMKENKSYNYPTNDKFESSVFESILFK